MQGALIFSWQIHQKTNLGILSGVKHWSGLIAAQMKRDSSRAGTPKREEADREYYTAMALFRAVAREIR